VIENETEVRQVIREMVASSERVASEAEAMEAKLAALRREATNEGIKLAYELDTLLQDHPERLVITVDGQAYIVEERQVEDGRYPVEVDFVPDENVA
jgi:hypothetical protein